MRTDHLLSLGLVTLLTVVVSGRVSHAELTVFTDRSAWEAAVGPFVTEDFEDAPLGELLTGPGFTFAAHRVGEISIGAKGDRLGIDQNPTIRDTADALSPNGTRHLGGVLSSFEVIMQAAIIFDYPVTAFGADWSSTANQTGVRWNIQDELVELSDHLAGDGDGFLGVVASQPFREVVLTTRAREDYGFDNVRFPVPEPASVLLLWLGCCPWIRWSRTGS